MNAIILHTVIIYTLSYCPYCIKAKELLNKKNVAYQEIVVDDYSEAQRLELKNKSGGKHTLPQIFIDGMHIGGCDDLYKLEAEGKLDELLTNAKHDRK
jgi:glutaredoxin 3